MPPRPCLRPPIHLRSSLSSCSSWLLAFTSLASPRVSARAAKAALLEWTQAARLGPHQIRKGPDYITKRFSSTAGSHQDPRGPPPTKWRDLESTPQTSVTQADGKIIIADDKQGDKAWMADGPDVVRWLHQTAELDAEWT
eukprot:7060718-Pyramimonas_sp.AAC.1